MARQSYRRPKWLGFGEGPDGFVTPDPSAFRHNRVTYGVLTSRQLRKAERRKLKRQALGRT
jgi:hypothetical protein